MGMDVSEEFPASILRVYEDTRDMCSPKRIYVPVNTEPNNVAGIVMRHCLISSVCGLFRRREEFSVERRTILGETFCAFLSFP